MPSRLQHTRTRLLFTLLFASFLVSPTVALSGGVDMDHVSTLMKAPVRSILQDASVVHLQGPGSLKTLGRSGRPVVLLVYRNLDRRSSELATLIRFLARDFHHRIDFYALEVSPGSDSPVLHAGEAKKALHLEKVPAALFFNSSRIGETQQETGLESPTLEEYRTPGRLFWKACYAAAARFLDRSL